MEKGLIDIYNKAKRLRRDFGELSQYNVSCMTLINIIDELKDAEKVISIIFKTDSAVEMKKAAVKYTDIHTL